MTGKASDHPAAMNVFPDALQHVATRQPWRWHGGAAAPHSSQALCVSVWGTLATRPERAVVLGDIFAAAGLKLPVAGAPEIVCEDQNPKRLNEYPVSATPTTIDVAVRWDAAVLVS
jgi:hypothetical protein